MEHDRDEANLMGQIAGIITVMSAVIQALPPTARKRLEQHLRVQFESLLAAMQKTEPSKTGSELEGAKWIRELFLRKIAEPNKLPKARKASPPVANAVDILL